jgi:hypothetical protein
VVANDPTSGDSEESDDEADLDAHVIIQAPTAHTRGKQLKSGRVTTGNHFVTKEIRWPHHVVVGSDGEPPSYEILTLEQLVLGHMKIAAKEDEKTKAFMYDHLITMMSDVTKYGFAVVKAFHSSWLQHIESERATWASTRLRRELRQEQVASHLRIDNKKKKKSSVQAEEYALALQDSPSPRRAQRKRHQKPANKRAKYDYDSAPSPPKAPAGTKTCTAFNKGSCSEDDSHDGLEHICQFCMKLTRYMNVHQSRHCRKRAAAAKELSGLTRGYGKGKK